jgi:hypothetical protein
VSQGGYTHVTRASGTILTAAIYNNDHLNHIYNQNPVMTGAYSDTLAQYQASTDPGAIGTENLADTLAGEIERIRYQLRAITGEAQWYHPPASTLKGVGGTADGSVPLSKLVYTSQGNLLMRKSPGTGSWEQGQIKDLADLTPLAGDWFLAQAAAGGAPRRVNFTSISQVGVVMPQGRLTLGANGPAFISGNLLGQNAISYVPYTGWLVPVWTGTGINAISMGGPLSQLTTDNTKSPAACVSNSVYDIFFWVDTGNTPRISRGPPWTSSTARGAGVNTSELEQVNGLWVNKQAITNGPAAQRGTYLGSIVTNASAVMDFALLGGQEQGRLAYVSIYNQYHSRRVTMMARDVQASWNIPIGSWAFAGNNGNNQFGVLNGMYQETSGSFGMLTSAGYYNLPDASDPSYILPFHGLTSDNSNSFVGCAGNNNSAAVSTAVAPEPARFLNYANMIHFPPLGVHTYQMMNYGWLTKSPPGGSTLYFQPKGYGVNLLPTCAATVDCWY